MKDKSIKLGRKTDFCLADNNEQCVTKQGIFSLPTQHEPHDTQALCLVKEL